MVALTEDERALLYREQWDRKIEYRANQIQQLAGDSNALAELWASYWPVYSGLNDIGNPFIGPYEGDFFCLFDVDDYEDGEASASQIATPPGVKRAGHPTKTVR